MEKSRAAQEAIAITWKLRKTFCRFAISHVGLKDFNWLSDELFKVDKQ